MTTQTPPLHKLYALGGLGRAGAEVTLTAKPDEMAKIARWAEIRGVEKFEAHIKLRKHSASNFSFDAALVADVVQDCVVTLEPVRGHVELPVHRELHLVSHTRRRTDPDMVLSDQAGEDDMPEEIETLEYDLAAPLLEEFALALDPYPRAPGVEFATTAAPEEATAPRENPFAVLKTLKKPS